MDRLLVCGWDDDTGALLEALRLHAGLRATAVCDPDTASLVRARSATQLACTQHVHQTVDSADFDAVLIGVPELTPELASSAAARGADLVLRGDLMDAHALEAAATAAARHGVALTVLRPSIRNAGQTFLTDLLAAEPRWQPTVLDIEVRADRPALGLLRDALAVATRLVSAMPMSVIASAAGLDSAEPLALSAELRYAVGSLVTLAARKSDAPGMRVAAQASAGTLELRGEPGQSRLRVTPWNSRTEDSVLRDPTGIEAEAERVARVRNGEGIDAQHAHREASILQAIEGALVSGSAEGVRPAGMRSTFRVLSGGAESPSPRVGALHLV